MADSIEEILKQYDIEPIRHHFVIEPKKGVGPIQLGMKKEAVSDAFSYVYRSFFKTQDSKVRSDHCEVVGLIVHYDQKGQVNCIEIDISLRPIISLELFERNITGITYRDLIEFLSELGVKAEKTYDGYKFPEMGFSAFNSHFNSVDDQVEFLILK